ncbi:hypothetical protein F8S13_22465 [Chloroflexia bacterium SDU3-3]|nr:hypothetical protein F8S13_22465 [Chloroflexia bacterium SDU3-3]
MKIGIRIGLVVAIALTGIGLAVTAVHDLAAQRALYQFEQGIWAPVEAERQFLLLQSTVQALEADPGAVDLSTYTLRRDVSLGYLSALVTFTQGNPTFDTAQLALVDGLQADVQTYRRLDAGGLPDPARARQLTQVMDDAVRTSHELVNIRRQIGEAASVRIMQTMQTALMIQVAIVVLLLIGCVWVVWATHQALMKDLALVSHEKSAAETMNQQLRAFLMQAEELAIEQERVRVAREIHDGLGHHLNNIKIHSSVAHHAFDHDSAMARSALAMVKAEVTQAYRELRRAIDILVSEKPFLGTLEDLLAQPLRDCELNGVHAELRVSGIPRTLADQTKHALYRIAQEALNNVRRHAHAANASIWIDYRDQMVQLLIEDDGVGLAPSAAQHIGHGLHNLHERALFVGGKTAIETAAGKGVRVMVEVPG